MKQLKLLMTSTKNICSSRTSKTFVWLAVLLLGGMTACQKDTAPVNVSANLFPVSSETASTARTEAFGEEPILLRLDSRQYLSNDVVSTLLDPLKGERTLVCDRPLFLNGDSIPSQTNLLNTPLANLTLLQADGANGKYDSHYIIRINAQQDSTFFVKTQGVYVFRFVGTTQHNYGIDEEALVLVL